VNLDELHDCLQHAYASGEPLSKWVLSVLLREVDQLRNGRESYLLRKKVTNPGNSPIVDLYVCVAVHYLHACENSELDPTPIKTVRDVYGVSNSTVHRWKASHKTEQIAINPPPTSEAQWKNVLRMAGESYRQSREDSQEKQLNK